MINENLSFLLAAYTLTGRRENNQDSHLCIELDNGSNIQYALAVADGMGGEAGGETASKLAVEVFRNFLEQNTYLPLDKWRQTLSLLYQRANSEIFHVGRRDPNLQGMGTTFVTALVVENHLIAANVGDSRLYKIQSDRAYQISKDHNMLAKLMAQKKHSQKYLRKREEVLSSSLIRSLGDSRAPKVDFFPRTGTGYPLKPGDIYLLCSDGLTGNPFHPYLKPEDMIEILNSTSNLQEACKRMVHLAFDRGSDDNITAVLIKVQPKRRIITGSMRLKRRRINEK
ncbi:MAG: serine/threonine-protein phosphatase [Planctomycetota bacterium]|nr:MAG: serine/threonine-protein phosphatase [Planctomycetota bacterium]